MIRTFDALLAAAARRGERTVVVAGADSRSALAAVAAARRLGIARPLLVGVPRDVAAAAAEVGLDGVDPGDVLAADAPEEVARAAAAAAAEGRAELLLKGSLRTDQLLRAVLRPEAGLRRGGLLSDVLLYEDVLSGERRLVAVTDGGITARTDAGALRGLIANAVAVMRALGLERPRVALLGASEVVSEAVPASVLAAGLAAEVADGYDVQGPLALDVALLASAARAKGIAGPVAGRADVLVAPSLEAGNLLGKAVKYFAGSVTAHVAVGARVPVLIPSRVESPDDKLASIALGVLVGSA